MTKLATSIVIAAIVFVGCTPGESETPVQAVRSIIQLYEARDFDSLVRTVASFKLNNGFIKLSLMPNGKWGFHL